MWCTPIVSNQCSVTLSTDSTNVVYPYLLSQTNVVYPYLLSQTNTGVPLSIVLFKPMQCNPIYCLIQTNAV